MPPLVGLQIVLVAMVVEKHPHERILAWLAQLVYMDALRVNQLVLFNFFMGWIGIDNEEMKMKKLILGFGFYF